MPKPRLNPDDLTVASFSTAAELAGPSKTIITIPDPNDPTAATWCYICPAETYDGNCY